MGRSGTSFIAIVCALIAQVAVTHAADPAIPPQGLNRPLPDEMCVDSRNLAGLDEKAYARMSLDDPLLHLAWWHLLGTMRIKYSDEPTPRAALLDLRRRGDSATPMILKLMKDNQDSNFEGVGFGAIEVGHLNPQPFVEYAQQMLRERALTSNAGNATIAVTILLDYGDKADRELVEWYAKARPYLGPTVKAKIWAHDQSHGIKYPYPDTTETSEIGEVPPPPPPSPHKPSVPNNDGSKVSVLPILWLTAGGMILAWMWAAMKRRNRR